MISIVAWVDSSGASASALPWIQSVGRSPSEPASDTARTPAKSAIRVSRLNGPW